MKAALYLNDVAPKDGTYFGTTARAVPLAPLLQNAKFDGSAFSWIGSISDDVGVCLTASQSKAKTFDDLLAREVMMAGEGATSDLDMFAHAVNNIFGAKMKIITGFHGTSEITIAMERGEVDGMCGLDWASLKSQRPDWLRDKTANILVQVGLEPDAELSRLGVPQIWKYLGGEDDRRAVELIVGQQVFGRPYLAPPGVAAEPLRILRAAFTAASISSGPPSATSAICWPVAGSSTLNVLPLLAGTHLPSIRSLCCLEMNDDAAAPRRPTLTETSMFSSDSGW